MNNSIRFVYFDIGGVLLDFKTPQKTFLSSLGLPIVELEQLMAQQAPARADGSLTEVGMEVALRERFDCGHLPQGFWSDCAWVERFQPIVPMHTLVRDLVGAYGVGLLSNVSQAVFEKSLPFGKGIPDVAYDSVVTSYSVGVGKPNLEIYRIALQKTPFKAEEVLFIDDMPANVVAAKTVGMQARIFNPAEAEKEAAELRTFLLS